MKAFFAVTVAFLAGIVFACMVPDGRQEVELATMVFTSPDADAPDAVAEADADVARVPAAPRRLAEFERAPQPISRAQPSETAAAGVARPSVILATAEQPAARDWPQWGGSPARNNAPRSENIPVHWELGEIDRQSGQWDAGRARAVKWVARLGSETYGNLVVADGRVFVGTNNAAGYLPRYPKAVDLGCLLCFSERDGTFLWQYSSEKLSSGRVHDWPMQGICCSPLVDGDRAWLVSNRGEVVCLDPEGFYDGENDGPFREEPSTDKLEADVVWKFDMMSDLGVRQHNMASCSVTSLGELLFVNTSNGVDESEINVPAPDAPSFVALEKETGNLVWGDDSPGKNILHGQWSSPAAGMLGGVPQVVFAGGDGWVYGFRADRGDSGRGSLLWKFDCNPKQSEWLLNGRGTRNNIIATPVLYNGFVYVAIGQDPENGEGQGCLWCIDPSRRGDVSPHLAVMENDHSVVVPHRRVKAVDPQRGETVIDNPNSAAVWRYDQYDRDGNGRIDFEETMHRTMGTVAIAEDLLFVADFSGLFHCVDAKTGRPHWTYDMLASAWGSPLITHDHVYAGDEDGDVAIFRLSEQPHDPVSEINMLNCVYSTPVVANGVLYVTNRTHLFAIAKGP
jgi:outer membrane protein assembly factor BamB